MDFKKDAHIILPNGKDIGNLNRFVLDPRTRQVTDIIFERGLLNSQEFVIPIDLVDHTSEDKVFLKESVHDPDQFIPFVDEHYVLARENPMTDSAFVSADPGLRMYYYYPPLSPIMVNPLTSNEYPDANYKDSYVPGLAHPGGSPDPLAVTGSDEEAVRKEEDLNIPKNTVALKEGAKVISADSKHVGNIQKLFVDPKGNQTTHLLITKGLIFKSEKLIPVDWVKTFGEDEVFLSVNQGFLENLPDYKGK